MSTRRKYTEDFKKDAVRVMASRGTQTVEEIATRPGMNTGMLHRWYREYGEASQDSEERARAEELRRRGRAIRPKVSKLVANDALCAYVQDRLAGEITTPDGVVRGPNQGLQLEWPPPRSSPRSTLGDFMES